MTIGLARRLWGPRAVSVSARRSVFAQGDDAHRSTVRVGMPHLNAGGLSESWLFRHAGDQHWQAIGALSGTTTEHLKTELGARLYPTFLAVRATYEAPLSVVLENDSLSSQVDLSWAARGYTHGFVTLASERNRLQFEMLTMLAERSPTSGELRAAQPSSRWVGTAALGLGRRAAPGIVALAKAARNGERHDDVFAGDAFCRPLSTLGCVRYEPSPYSDFNGAGLLYFASYVSIADTAERHLARQFGWLEGSGDWALATSTVRRDVFYYGNIRLGDSVSSHLIAVEWGASTVKTHVRMVRDADGRTLADLVTLKRLGGVVAASRHDPKASSFRRISGRGGRLSRWPWIRAAR